MKLIIKNIRDGSHIGFRTLLMFKVAVGIVFIVSFSIVPNEGHSQDKPGTVTIVTENEPGTKLIMKGKVLLPDGSPAAGARIWVFQTDAEGYYKKSSDGKDLGWRASRISEVFAAGPEGEFQIHTIRPAGYPERTTAEHIHFRISTPQIEEQEHTIFFTDDARVTDSFRNSIRRDDRLYLVDLKMNDQHLVGVFNLVFK